MSVDINVVMDKLHNFETADDMAEFFRGYGIKAIPRSPVACAVTKFVVKETGVSDIWTNTSSVAVMKDDEPAEVFIHTDAMVDFIERYDHGYYQDLVEEGFGGVFYG